MANRGLLLVTMEPPADMADEFNDWYDTEHFPQRRALPGFESGSRWVCLEGWPRWLALYDLASVAALETPAYLAVSGGNSTPWSKRILPRTIGRQRVIAEQIVPGDAVLAGDAAPARLLVVRYPKADAGKAAALQRNWAAQPGATSARVFLDADGAMWLLVSFNRALVLAELSQEINALPADLVNLYASYRR
jgi:hypothetical protein